MRRRKTPDAATINKLYWWDGLNQREIGAKYGVSGDAIHWHMKRMGIKTRPGKRPREVCKEEGCEEPVIRVRQMRNGLIVWVWNPRCAAHYHLWRRATSNAWDQKHRRKTERRQSGRTTAIQL